jgi:hypothetical protein
VQTTFRIPIIVNTSPPFITFSQTSIPNNTNLNTTIGNFTVHNIKTPYRLQLLDTYNNTFQLDTNSNTLILQKPLINNQTQIPIKVALINQTNATILTTTFPLTVTYINPCLTKDCGNGTCIYLNQR